MPPIRNSFLFIGGIPYTTQGAQYSIFYNLSTTENEYRLINILQIKLIQNVSISFKFYKLILASLIMEENYLVSTQLILFYIINIFIINIDRLFNILYF